MRLWTRREEAAEQMRRLRHNPTYLPDVELPDDVLITSDLGTAVDDAPWPQSYIDWDAAADALRIDYSSVEFEGVTFWYR